MKIKNWLKIIMISVIPTLILVGLRLRFTPFTIPTTSMEGTFPRGTYIFADNYFGEVKNNDLIVFNHLPNNEFPDIHNSIYFHRCVGIAGDKLEIKDGQLFINDKKTINPPKIQYPYIVKSRAGINEKVFKDLNINEYDFADMMAEKQTDYKVFTTESKLKELRKLPYITDIQRFIKPKNEEGSRLFPNHPNMNWNEDHYGPITIPKKGLKINLNAENIAIYGTIIQKAEGLENVKISRGELLIDNQLVKEYTFKNNYYFVIGDNRHNSLDSRFLGFVPQNLIKGKIVFAW